MDVLKMLKEDHAKVEMLFDEFEKAKGQKRRAIVEQIRVELLVHARVEEDIVYPTLREAMDDFAALILEAHEEHHVVERTLEDLAQMNFDEEKLIAKMSVLRNLVEQHVVWEEKELFPAVRSQMELSMRQELGVEVERAKQTYMQPLRRGSRGGREMRPSMH